MCTIVQINIKQKQCISTDLTCFIPHQVTWESTESSCGRDLHYQMRQSQTHLTRQSSFALVWQNLQVKKKTEVSIKVCVFLWMGVQCDIDYTGGHTFS